ncbi:hypothetical protein MY5147_007188 [Beauveria neobassiana]
MFWRTNERRVLLLGVDYAGKTTLLYRWLLGETITTMPTIGFNVETINHPAGYAFTVWDVGGCDKIRPLYRHYFQDTEFVIFVHHCADMERLDEQLELLKSSICDDQLRHVPVLIVLSVQDLMVAATKTEDMAKIRAAYESLAASCKRPAAIEIFDCPGFSATTSENPSIVLDEVVEMLRDKHGSAQVAPQAAKNPDTKADTVALNASDDDERAKTMTEADGMTPADFWQAFADGSLAPWDHYNHLKAGFFVLIGAFEQGSGVLDAADTFVNHLERLRAGNPQRFRNTTHRTMTVFWLAQLQIAAANYSNSLDTSRALQREDFKSVLLHSPTLADARLWTDYYSKDYLFTQNAKDHWCLPDLKPLPSVTTTKQRQCKDTPLATAADADRLIGFGLTVVQQTLASKARRGPISNALAWSGSVESLVLPAFKALYGVTGDEWRAHYSAKLWESVEARMQFQPPDKKPLPNVIAVSGQTGVGAARAAMVQRFVAVQEPRSKLPPFKDLAVMAAVLAQEIKDGSAGNHGVMLQSLFELLYSNDEMKQDTDAHHKRQSQVVSKALELPCAGVDGLTQRMFWAQQLLHSLVSFEGTEFGDFIRSNVHLAYKELPLVYYSPMLWASHEAAIVYLGPDRKPGLSTSTSSFPPPIGLEIPPAPRRPPRRLFSPSLLLPAVSTTAMESFTIKTPCSSANIGPGFDVIGLALSIYLELRVTVDRGKTRSEAPLNCRITYEGQGEGGSDISLNPQSNLITRVALYVLRCHDQRAFPIETHVHIKNPIPLGRGLGSSGAAVVAGVFLGRELGGLHHLDNNRLFDYCLMIGTFLHPDNVGAALFGGFVGTYLMPLKPEDASRIEVPLSEVLPSPAGGVDTGKKPPEPPVGIGHHIEFPWNKEIKAVAIVPGFVVPTAEARAVLPEKYARNDVTFNLQRIALLPVALGQSPPDPELIHLAMQDRIHQPYRQTLIPGLCQVVESMSPKTQPGFLGVCLSGAGPTILALATSNFEEIANKIIEKLKLHNENKELECRWMVLEPAKGTEVIRS